MTPLPSKPPPAVQFPRAYPSLSLSAQFRQSAEDFYVEEQLGFELSGEGEHRCIEFEKTGHNTHWVIAALAKYAGVNERDIGYCGRKDRHAVTRQWISIYCPPSAKHKPQTVVDWSQFTMEGVRILSTATHHKKLRLGNHQRNYFRIALHDVRHHVEVVSSDHDLMPSLTNKQKQLIEKEVYRRLALGVPNYFGEQRFGRGANNLVLARQWLEQGVAPPKKQRSMVMSAARAYLFNTVLAYRVQREQWRTAVAGDVLVDQLPTGPLWGRGRSLAQDESLVYEQQALEDLSVWCEKLEHLGLKQERRAFVLMPTDVELCWQGDSLLLSFCLPAGAFATSVLAEVANCINNTA